MAQHPTMRPHDLIVLLYAQRRSEPGWSYGELAGALGLSTSQVFESLRRASDAGLFLRDRHAVASRALRAFVIHGARYAFPPVTLAATTGWPTASTHVVLARRLRGVSDDSASRWVWPDPDGPSFGTGLLPLHPCVRGIAASVAEPMVELYSQLALFDELRIGGLRGAKVAAELLAASIEEPDAAMDGTGG